MKRMFALLFLLLVTALPSFASSITFGNTAGTLTGTNAGLIMSGSELTSITGLLGPQVRTGNLGTVQFTTGSLISGNLQQGGIFNSGGTFIITGNGTGGIPTGVIFAGTWSGPVTDILVTLSNGTHSYVIQGVLTGTFYNGQSVNAVDVQLTVNTGKGFFNGNTMISGGSTVINQAAVPEPSTLTFLGTGLVTLGFAAKRKLLRTA